MNPIVECPNCGFPHENARNSQRRTFCGVCISARKVISNHFGHLRHRGFIDLDEYKDCIGEVFARFGEASRESGWDDAVEPHIPDSKRKRRLADHAGAGPDKGVCPYCGKPSPSQGAYCKNCKTERLDNVHRVTGRTNGWDKAGKRPTAVQDGWRGAPVMGSKSLRSRVEIH